MTLVISPLKKEFKALVNGLKGQGFVPTEGQTGRLPFVEFRELDMICSIGGHGKTQFALQTQHLLGYFNKVSRVICTGTAGSLTDLVKPLDVVIGTKTIEHDYQEKFSVTPLPEFLGCEKMRAVFSSSELLSSAILPSSTLSSAILSSSAVSPPLSVEFNIHFGPIASGDEDIIEPSRAHDLHKKTGCLAVAWEGAGGARAAKFHGLPFLEIRAASDSSNENTAADFNLNLVRAMENISRVIVKLKL